MDKVIFADGTELQCLFFGNSTVGLLFITLNTDVATAAMIATDREKTARITYRPESGEETTFEDYIKFEYLVNEPTGGVRIALRQLYASEV